jgi:4-hydroxybenzoate polyprenyltransferase
MRRRLLRPKFGVEMFIKQGDVMTKQSSNNIVDVIKLLRPGQWVKNAFVAAPLLFARQYHDADQCLRTLTAAAGFCLASSAVYIFNDLCDRAEDQQHPTKKNRPIASEAVTVPCAAIMAIVLVGLSLAPAFIVSSRYLYCVILYLAISFAYSMGIKHIAILDVMTIAGGFVLRIFAGSFAVDVPTSHWLVLCTIMVATFLGFAKRRSELVSLKENSVNTRTVLQDYSVKFLDQVIAMVTGATIICYALYTVDARTLAQLGTHSMLLTVPCVMYGMFRYIYLAYHRGEGEDPTQMMLTDIPMLVNLVVWIILCYIVVSFGRQFDPFR